MALPFCSTSPPSSAFFVALPGTHPSILAELPLGPSSQTQAICASALAATECLPSLVTRQIDPSLSDVLTLVLLCFQHSVPSDRVPSSEDGVLPPQRGTGALSGEQ